MRSRLIICMLLIGYAVAGFGQTIRLPDDSLTACLQGISPTLIDTNGELIIANAESFVGDLDCDSMGITDLSGIAHFQSTTTLSAVGNNLTTVPSLLEMAALAKLDLSHNQIATLPSFAGMSALKEVFLGNNRLTNLPDFSNCTQLWRLSCYGNQLIAIPGYPGCSALEILTFYNNEVTSMPDLSYYPILRHFWASTNYIEDISSILSHPNYADMEVISAPFNQLTFRDVIPFISHMNYATDFSFFAQRVHDFEDTVGQEGRPFTLNVGIDEGLENTTYEWFKGQKFLTITNTSTLNFDTLTTADQGYYKCVIRNTLFPGDSLFTRQSFLSVTPCFTADDFELDVRFEDCQTGSSMDILILNPDVTDAAFTLINKNSDDSTSTNTPSFSSLPFGVYSVRVSDGIYCSATLPEIEIEKNDLDCESIFTPNGDGNNDAFYIASEGTAKIVTVDGVLVKELNTPGYWDGTDQNNEPLSTGYYGIILNGNSPIKVSLILE